MNHNSTSPQLLTSVATAGIFPQEINTLNHALLTPTALALRLQTTLEIEKLLDLFSQTVTYAIPHDGLTFSHPDSGLHLSQGRISRHSCSYRLSLENESLGELRFLRGRKFREAELSLLEEFLAVLAYPIRNALWYRRALLAAQTDVLTGLSNRLAMETLVNKELAQFRRGGPSTALVVIDLDHFKRINDEYGHLTGDLVLRTVAQALQKATRKSDSLFRYGGEEFVVLIPNTDVEQAQLAAERFCQAVRDCEVILEDGTQLALSASVGVAMCELQDSCIDLFQRADAAMYAAKTAGRNQARMASYTGDFVAKAHPDTTR